MKKLFSFKKISLKEKWQFNNLIILIIGLFLCLSLSIAYASLSQMLGLETKGKFEAMEGLQIFKIVRTNPAECPLNDSAIIQDKTIYISGTFNDLSCEARYNITIVNKTNEVLQLTDIFDSFGKSSFQYSLNGIKLGEVFAPNTSLTFELVVTYKAGINLPPSKLQILNANIMFEFQAYQVPIIVVEPNLVSVGINESYNLLNGVVGYDRFANTLKASVVSDGGLNLSTMGSFAITYSTTDGYSTVYGTRTITVLDNIPPNTFTPTLVDKTLNTIQITGTTTDIGTGVVSYYCSIDGGANWVAPKLTVGGRTSIAADCTFKDLTANTNYSFIMKAVDGAGNERISEPITIKTKQTVTQIFYMPVTTYSDGPEWVNQGDIYGRYNTTQTSSFTYSEETSCTLLSGSRCAFTRYITYSMIGVGTSNSYKADGSSIVIPTEAKITSVVVHTRFGAGGGGSNNYNTEAAMVLSNGAMSSISWSGATKDDWSDDLSASFSSSSLPSRGSTLSFLLKGQVTKTVATGRVRVRCSYIYAEFTAQWEAD